MNEYEAVFIGQRYKEHKDAQTAIDLAQTSILIVSKGVRYEQPLYRGAVGRRPLLRVDLKKLNDPARDKSMAARIGTHPRILGALLGLDEMKGHLQNARDFIEKYAKDGGCVVEFGCNGGRHRSVGGASCLSAVAVELGYSVTLVHYSLEHWSSMRCGGTCRECQDVTAGLDLCKRHGWAQVTAMPVGARHTVSSRRGPPPPPPPAGHRLQR